MMIKSSWHQSKEDCYLLTHRTLVEVISIKVKSLVSVVVNTLNEIRVNLTSQLYLLSKIFNIHLSSKNFTEYSPSLLLKLSILKFAFSGLPWNSSRCKTSSTSLGLQTTMAGCFPSMRPTIGPYCLAHFSICKCRYVEGTNGKDPTIGRQRGPANNKYTVF